MHDVNDILAISGFLKAHPATEGGKRYVYVQASDESVDQQGEVVLAKALRESADYYLRYGNLDLDHVTQVGPKQGIPNYAAFEIGRPVEVKLDGARTMVKGEVYQGDAKSAENANLFWASLTAQQPPQRWYPSVAGAILAKSARLADGGAKVTCIERVRWTNIGFSKTPVNAAVPSVSTVPLGVLAKSWTAHGLEFVAGDLLKGLESGYGTDSATLEGGAALRRQSLDRQVQSYWDFREHLAGDIRRFRVKASVPSLIDHAERHYGLAKALAAEWVEQFLGDLKRARQQGAH